ncbi:MAG: phosphatidylserine decarboxylase family protein [Bacteroidales bacterium]|nr:phosphatidylserine decarboxylase family protein [Bacteroidales bacterium]
MNIILFFTLYQLKADMFIPLASILIFVITALFFRIPSRKSVKNKNHVIAPADGTIIAIEEIFEDEYLKTVCKKISIFMSVFNVHQNIIPVNGKILYCKHHPGKYLVAWHPKSSLKNEYTSIVIETSDGLKLMIRQIAGFVARRIICNVKENDYVEQGNELGFILFGSRVDIYLPANTVLKVKTGDKVKAKINQIAGIANTDVNKECKWYQVCSMKVFYEQGKLDGKWIELYCKGAWLNCIRYQMEENGESHPDNMMPDGSIDEMLK